MSRRARIGGNSVVTKDVPEGATVVGVPARQMSAKPSDEASFMPYAVHSGLDSDPRERTIRALINEMQSQRSAISNLEKQLVNLARPAAVRKEKQKSQPKSGN